MTDVVRFWAMGYEGEVVAQLLPEFERRNPGIRVELQQLPITAAHEKLLTAYRRRFVARRRARSATPGCPSSRCSMRCSRWTRASRRRRRCRRAITSPVPGTPASSTAPCTRCPGTSRRGCRSIAATCSQQAGVMTPPRDLGRMEARAGRDQARGRAGPLRDPVAAQRVRAAVEPGHPAPEPLLRDDGRYGNFRSPGFKRALAFYRDMFDQAPGAGRLQYADRQCLGRVRSRLLQLLRQWALEHRRVPQAPAAATGRIVDDDAAAGRTGPGRVGGRRGELRGVQEGAGNPEAAWKLSRTCPNPSRRCAFTR